ncbi:hypothetical protein EVAR_54510_1 [Eumeta japonica]|uniref:Uncharacterized protein n=1 Tax=Eumeta variegata TaxID=151549 RepID=A0A4C1YM02_EUMVA|nr:hypothetical protein EVAR_54510_1 [Eumeta japonica]
MCATIPLLGLLVVIEQLAAGSARAQHVTVTAARSAVTVAYRQSLALYSTLCVGTGQQCAVTELGQLRLRHVYIHRSLTSYKTLLYRQRFSAHDFSRVDAPCVPSSSTLYDLAVNPDLVSRPAPARFQFRYRYVAASVYLYQAGALAADGALRANLKRCESSFLVSSLRADADGGACAGVWFRRERGTSGHGWVRVFPLLATSRSLHWAQSESTDDRAVPMIVLFY